MANLLLVDDSDVAARALQSILARRNHRLAVARNSDEGWRVLQDIVKIDLLFLELKLPGQNGVHFLQRVRQDSVFRHLPVVVYSSVGEPQVVKFTLALKVQNYLIKPYNDEIIYDEVAKAGANPWRNLHFEEERSFCAQMQLQPEALRQMRLKLQTDLEAFQQALPDWTKNRQLRAILDRADTLATTAEAAGVWGAVDVLTDFRAKADAADWNALQAAPPDLTCVARLIQIHLHPDFVPPALLSEGERDEQVEAHERTRWTTADVATSGPVLPAGEIGHKLDTLEGWPVIDGAAAAFQMAANGQAASLTHAMDLASQDPGLAAAVMIAANKLPRDETMNAIEDARLAVSLLGEIKLHAFAKSLVMAEERHMRLPPITWANFWIFQLGVARLTQFVCDSLEFRGLASCAYTAGLLHDAGRLVLLRLCPFGFEAMVHHSRKHQVPLRVAEKRYIGWDAREMGEYLGKRLGLPAKYCHVIRWAENPDQAPADADLVAAVSLARDVCLHNHVGFSGDTPKDQCPPLAETPAWQVLRNQVFPSFNLTKFEAQAHAHCATVKQELLGRTR